MDRIAHDLHILARDAGELASAAARRATNSAMDGGRRAAESVRHGAARSQQAIRHEISRAGDFAQERPLFLTLVLCGIVGFVVAALLLYPVAAEKLRD